MSIEPQKRVAFSGAAMGTRWSVVAYVATHIDPAAIESLLVHAVQTVDDQMSTWKPHSDLMRLNRAPAGRWQPIPDELSYVLALGLGIARASGGCFDMAVLAQVEAWGFGPSAAPAALPPSVRAPGEPIELDPKAGRARRLVDAQLDLSGIAKGFAVDLLARTLERAGITDFLVSIDGELQAAGRHPDGRPWQVGLEAPMVERRDVASVLALTDCSLATSGDYRHRRQAGGGWISHTIDPRTGYPVANRLASVTVRMDDCVTADAWATALLVAGDIEGPAMARAQNLDTIFMLRDGADIRTVTTGKFAASAP